MPVSMIMAVAVAMATARFLDGAPDPFGGQGHF